MRRRPSSPSGVPHPLALLPLLALSAACTAESAPEPASSARPASLAVPALHARVTVDEGTSMAVGVSPDGGTLVIDLQGTLWTLSASGGTATPVTDGFDDARQPMWSPDGASIVFQGYRGGGYDVWAVAPDGSGLRQLTSGDHDDREPAWSPDGARVAFSSDRGEGGGYDIWVLEVGSSELRQVTRGLANDHMPSWSPDGSEVAFARTERGATAAWAVSASGGGERRLTGEGGVPSWGPGGEIVYHVQGGGSSRLELGGRSLTGEENVFPFRVSWSGPGTFFYTADGKIRRRSLGEAAPATVEFEATLEVRRNGYTRRGRDFDGTVPRRVLGVVSPRISPDGSAVAFVALGDLWLARNGEAPERLTRDAAMDVDPAWSPDGSRLAFASDRAGGVLNLWVKEVATGDAWQLTDLPVAAMAPSWSPDGTRIAFLEVGGAWRRAAVSTVDVATGAVTRIHPTLFGPGAPTWSPDGRTVAVAALLPYSSRFREGMNRILLIPASAESEDPETRWIELPPHYSLDSRAGAGPAWSPDGTRMAYVQEGRLAVLPVTPEGAAAGPPSHVTTDLAHEPSWAGDSRHVLYQANDRLRVVDLESGAATDWPLELTYVPDIPSERLVVHAGRLVDGLSPEARHDVDILVDGNRIVGVAAHDDASHAGRTVVDASALTVMPGLVEFHTHLQPDFGEAHGRAWLAFGVTTVRSPGGTPYEAAELREAVDAGTRLGPRIFATGYLMEWQRSYYKMSVAVQNDAHLEAELERARLLEHDLLKSYVRMPDLQQRRIIEFAHGMGVPASSHEIYPSSASGVDGVEHTTGTSRRGYSPKVATLQRSYADVSSIIGAAEMTLTPTFALSSAWLRRLIEVEPPLGGDRRFGLLPGWLTAVPLAAGPPTGGRPTDAGPIGEFVMNVRAAGGRIVAGTDSPNPASLHAELMVYVAAGMTPFEALQTATVNPARALGLDAGTVEPGRLADLVAVAGNPLDDITHSQRVRLVIANGRVLEADRLVPPR